MIQQSMEQLFYLQDNPQCTFCHPKQNILPEITYILKNLIQQMKKQSPKSSSIEQTTIKHSSFYQILKCIFNNNKNINKKSFQCEHSRLKNLFSDKLRCSISELLIMSNQILIKYSKRDYQLDLIKNMINNVPDQIVNINKKIKIQTAEIKIQKQKQNQLLSQQLVLNQEIKQYYPLYNYLYNFIIPQPQLHNSFQWS